MTKHPNPEKMTRTEFEAYPVAHRQLLVKRGVIVIPDPIGDYDEDDDGTEPLSQDPELQRLGDAIDEPTKVGIGPAYEPHKI